MSWRMRHMVHQSVLNSHRQRDTRVGSRRARIEVISLMAATVAAIPSGVEVPTCAPLPTSVKFWDAPSATHSC